MEKVKYLTIAVWGERHKLLRYLMSGGMAAAVNFVFLYIFTEWVGLYYLISVVVAFIIAVVVSFLLQKYWTFQDRESRDVRRQMMMYVSVATINTVINTFLVYVFVEYGGLHYMFGQFFASGIIALESFFVYKFFIFKNTAQRTISRV